MNNLIKMMVFTAPVCMGLFALSSAFSFRAFADEPLAEHEWTAADWEPKRATPNYTVNNHPDNSIFQYDVTDYVTDGLVAHYDGIRNAGYDEGGNLKPHDPTLNCWKDLIPGGAEMNFYDNEGSVSGWRFGKAYGTDRKGYAKMVEPCQLGKGEVTIQASFLIDYQRNIGLASNDYQTNYRFFWADADTTSTKPGSGKMSFSWNCRYSQMIQEFDDGQFATRSGTWVKKNSGLNYKYMTYMIYPNPENIAVTNINIFPGTEVLASTAQQVTKSGSGNACHILESRTWGIGMATNYWGSCTPVKLFSNSANKDDTAKRFAENQMVELYYALRFYNRALTNDELVKNREIDEFRFHNNGGNVIVNTSYSECEGNEKTGAYWVNGVYEFSAGEHKVGNFIYEPKGYTLKVWDSDTGAWVNEINPETGTNLFYGSTFTYTNCNARSRVSMTWEWKTKGRKFPVKPTVKDYIQKDLRYHFDGIENAGLGVPRDTQAIVWKNLIPGEFNMTISNLVDEADAANCWTNSKACYLNGTTYTKLDGPPISYHTAIEPYRYGQEWTFETACEVTNNSENVMLSLHFYRSTWGAEGNAYQNCDTVYGAKNKPNNLTHFGTSYGFNSGGNTINDWGRQYFTVMRTCTESETNSYLFAGTARQNPRKCAASTLFYRCSFGLGGNVQFANQQQAGLYQSLRVYERPLRDEELAWNRKVDNIRFNDFVSTTNVIVETSPKDIECAEVGAYDIEGEWTFYPPEAIVQGKVKLPRACSVYEYIDDVWREIESNNGQLPYTYDADLMENRLVRIKWIYAIKGLSIIVR